MLKGRTAEIIVVDNGSTDGTAEFVATDHPAVRCQVHPAPLSFARAVNRGIEMARYSHVLLLNNDMRPHDGFFEPLVDAFVAVPDLFCATAQIFFPEGRRREEDRQRVPQPDRNSMRSQLNAPRRSKARTAVMCFMAAGAARFTTRRSCGR